MPLDGVVIVAVTDYFDLTIEASDMTQLPHLLKRIRLKPRPLEGVSGGLGAAPHTFRAKPAG
jgi:hypothetical protein